MLNIINHWMHNVDDVSTIETEINNYIIESNKMKKNIMEINNTTIIDKLNADANLFNMFAKFSYVMMIVARNSTSKKHWKKINEMLNIRASNFFNDAKLEEKLKRFTNLPSMYHKIFLEKIFLSHKNNTVSSIEKKLEIQMKKSLKTLTIDDVFLLIKMRNQYAHGLGYKSYFKMNTDINEDELKTILKDTIATIKNCSVVDNFKIINKQIFTLSYVLDAFHLIIKKTFDIEFVKNEKTQSWASDVIVYDIIYNKCLVSQLHIDLENAELKKKDPVGMIIKESTQQNDISVCSIFGHVNKLMSFCEVINLFVHYSSVIHSCFNKSPIGMINLDESNCMILEYFFEHLITHDENVIIFFGKNDYANIESELQSYSIYMLQQKCIYVLFDYYLHGHSAQTIKTPEEIVAKYNQINRNIINTQQNNVPKEMLEGLIINGSLMYTYITNNIIAFNTFRAFTYDKKKLFNEIVLSETITPFSATVAKYKNIIDQQLDKNNYASYSNYFTEN
jgi:hypothetical protein